MFSPLSGFQVMFFCLLRYPFCHLFARASSSSVRRPIVVSVLFNGQSRPSARAVPRPQPCDVCAGAQGKNRSIAGVCLVLLILGSGRRPIQAAAVASVMLYVKALRPLAEWRRYEHRGTWYMSPDAWLRRMVPQLNEWKSSRVDLLNDAALPPRLFVLAERLEAFLVDPSQRELITKPEVIPNFLNFWRCRPECNTSCFFLFCESAWPERAPVSRHQDRGD